MPRTSEYLAIGACAAGATFALTYPVKRLAVRFGWVVAPDERRVHTVTTPDVGGIAMFGGFLVAMLVARLLGSFNVLFSTSELVGVVMAGYEGHRGWINYLAVDPANRRSGVGRALMAEAERGLRAAGCPKINLQVRPENKDVITFYAAIGFSVEGAISLGKRLVTD